MGAPSHSIEAAATREGPYVTIDAIVDTGATGTQLPRSLVSQLGVRATEKAEFTLAVGGRVKRELAEVFVRVDGRIRSTSASSPTTAPRRCLRVHSGRVRADGRPGQQAPHLDDAVPPWDYARERRVLPAIATRGSS